MNIFLADIQCQLYGVLILKKISIVYIAGKSVWKTCVVPLREYATNVINFEKTNMLPLTRNLKLHKDTTTCYICGKRFLKKFAKKEKLLKS